MFGNAGKKRQIAGSMPAPVGQNSPHDTKTRTPRHDRIFNCLVAGGPVQSRRYYAFFVAFYLVRITKRYTFETMTDKKEITPETVPDLLDRDASTDGPKTVKSYRIRPSIFDIAEDRCKKQHDCGLSSIIEPLLIAYFNIDQKTPENE